MIEGWAALLKGTRAEALLALSFAPPGGPQRPLGSP